MKMILRKMSVPRQIQNGIFMTRCLNILAPIFLRTKFQDGFQRVLNVQVPDGDDRIHTADCAYISRFFGLWVVVHPLNTQRKARQQEVVVHIEATLFLVVN